MIVHSRVTESPVNDPVALQTVKDYLAVTGDSDDTLIRVLLRSAVRMSEAYTSLSLSTQERTIKLDNFPCYNTSNKWMSIPIPYGPVQSITTFTYVDSSGDTIEMVEDEDYQLDAHSLPAKVYALDEDGELTSWPSTKSVPNAVTIVYQAGYDNVSGDPVPEEAMSAILRQVKEMYDHREDEIEGATLSQLCIDSRRMLDNIKVYWNANL